MRILLLLKQLVIYTVFFIALGILSLHTIITSFTFRSRTTGNGTITPYEGAERVRPPVLDLFCQKFTRTVLSEFYLNYTATHLLFDVFPSQPDRFQNPGLTSPKYHFAINSAPRNFRARRTIRATWKKLLSEGSLCSGSLRFYVGRTSDEKTAAWVEKELKENPDDMILIDFCDAYENLSLKTYNIMNFVAETMPSVEWTVKMDDDILPNIVDFHHCFPVVQEKDIGIYGWVTIDQVHSADGTKYEITRGRYPNATFPPFTHGPTYVLRNSDLPALLAAGKRIPQINLEDVWFTGILADAAGVRRKNAPHFLSMYRKPKEFELDNLGAVMHKAFFFHSVSGRVIRKVWAKLPQSCGGTPEYSCDEFVHNHNDSVRVNTK